MKLAILYKEKNRKAEELYWKIKDYLSRSHKVVGKKEIKGSDFIITLGGDGTLIHLACEYAELGIPLVGINMGNLGFLTAAEFDDWRDAVDKLIDGKVFISERITLEANAEAKEYRAVNEAVIKSSFRVINLEIKVSGEDFLNVTGDGVIISTQTGSTAYSLSAGGSIVDSDLNCLIVTPINPIGLPIPSVVLSPVEKIEVNVVGGDDVSLVLDGQRHAKLSSDSRVVIRKGKDNVRFVYLDKKHFLKSLNEKFGLTNRASGK